MTLETFKSTFGIKSVDLYPSKEGQRVYGVANTPFGKFSLSGKAEINLKAPLFVYADKEVENLFYLSNNSGKPPVATL